ncbi:MAG: hypothetical protein ABEJ92_11290 [Halobacteriales archaeon]
MTAGYDIAVEDLTAEAVKAKAEELDIDLVGVADAETVADHPPPGAHEADLESLLYGAASIVVVARRTAAGASSTAWDDRNAHHSTQLGISELELAALDLVYFIEDHGHPSIMVPVQAARSKLYDGMDEGPLSLPHVAVEAGLGTLGLNLQLLTPEYGPRVVLGAIVTTADLEPDGRRTEGLCEGAECGRCLLACPGDAIDHFGMRVEDCRPHAEPWGFDRFLEHAEAVMAADDVEERQERLQGTDSLMIWQSMIHGAGVNTGCTNCADVCPVGEDSDRIEAATGEIDEATAAKRDRLADLRRAELEGELPPGLDAHERWIGDVPMDYADPDDDLTFAYEG